jgi:plastocyanin
MARFANVSILCMALAGAAAASGAGTLEVNVVDAEGQAVRHVAIYAEPLDRPTGRPATHPTAVMDQRNHAFVPHILVVQTGTDVDFPNSDSVSHHVYSFSDAKKFELPLYKGRKYPPVRFDRAGLVTLGCNIHDDMVGYVLVVDTPHFALTDDSGLVRIDGLAPGRYSVHVWTPRLKSSHLPEPFEVEIAAGALRIADVALAHKLYPPHDHGDSSLSWENY